MIVEKENVFQNQLRFSCIKHNIANNRRKLTTQEKS